MLSARPRALGAALVAAVAGACASAPCADDSDCPPGLVCELGPAGGTRCTERDRCLRRGCEPPAEGELCESCGPCDSEYDNLCLSPSGPGLYVCDTSSGSYYYHDCSNWACEEAGYSYWSGRCGAGRDGWEGCLCQY